MSLHNINLHIEEHKYQTNHSLYREKTAGKRLLQLTVNFSLLSLQLYVQHLTLLSEPCTVLLSTYNYEHHHYFQWRRALKNICGHSWDESVIPSPHLFKPCADACTCWKKQKDMILSWEPALDLSEYSKQNLMVLKFFLLLWFKKKKRKKDGSSY